MFHTSLYRLVTFLLTLAFIWLFNQGLLLGSSVVYLCILRDPHSFNTPFFNAGLDIKTSVEIINVQSVSCVFSCTHTSKYTPYSFFIFSELRDQIN